MAPLPKRRHSTKRGGKRKAALSHTLRSRSRCPQCKEWMIPHRVCANCGYYRGTPVIVKAAAAK